LAEDDRIAPHDGTILKAAVAGWLESVLAPWASGRWPGFQAEKCHDREPKQKPIPCARIFYPQFLIRKSWEVSLNMFRTGLVCLVLAGFAAAQTSSAPVLTPRPNTRVEELPIPGGNSSVAPDAPVITIKDLCDKPAGSTGGSADCKTVVTRSEFEKLINVLQPNMTKPQQKQIAARYAQFLIMANKAQELGLDKGPEFDEQMYLQRLQVLARLALEHMQKEAGQVSDAEIESYYREHSGDFRTVSYDKIYVPKQKQSEAARAAAPNDPEAQKKRQAAEAEMKEEADQLRGRAAAGEDLVKLQQEAYDFAGLKVQSTTANTHVEKVRKNALPPTASAIFELKKGDVSQVLNDGGAFMIYKIDDFQDQPLESVKEELSRMLQNQKLKTFSEELQKSVVDNTSYNDAYFTVPAPPSLRKPGEPSAQPTGAQASPAPGKK
jgi:hypothetical protein